MLLLAAADKNERCFLQEPRTPVFVHTASPGNLETPGVRGRFQFSSRAFYHWMIST